MLLEYIAEIPGVERLRYTTSHPREFTKRLITAHVQIPQLVNHLHLPVQHGSDKILMAMKRGYTCLEYKSLIRKIRQAKPNIPISSDFIVGFPGETDADFQELMDLVHHVQFDNSYCFIFSARPGTPAANLEDSTPRAMKVARLQALTSLIDENILRISQGMVGNTERVMIEGMAKDGQKLQGRTENNRVCNIDLPSLGQAKRLIGKMVPVVFTRALAHSLQAELVTR
jgi:tRNA-2-methylthio-N6-dimethylallyladenosine synthase